MSSRKRRVHYVYYTFQYYGHWTVIVLNQTPTSSEQNNISLEGINYVTQPLKHQQSNPLDKSSNSMYPIYSK